MTTLLDPIAINDTQLFKVSVYETDGVTEATPLSCVCSVWEADADTAVITAQAGTVGAGYAQYNWPGTSTPGNYEATLTVTIASGVVKSERFRVTVGDKPPEFTNDTDSDIGQVRLELGDDVDGDGVRPNGSNFTDAQLQVWLDREGSVMCAAAAACEALARQWARVANIAVGQRKEDLGAVSDQWAKQAERLREQYGGGGSGGFSIGMVRADGYAEEAESSGLEFSLDD